MEQVIPGFLHAQQSPVPQHLQEQGCSPALLFVFLPVGSCLLAKNQTCRDMVRAFPGGSQVTAFALP